MCIAYREVFVQFLWNLSLQMKGSLIHSQISKYCAGYWQTVWPSLPIHRLFALDQLLDQPRASPASNTRFPMWMWIIINVAKEETSIAPALKSSICPTVWLFVFLSLCVLSFIWWIDEKSKWSLSISRQFTLMSHNQLRQMRHISHSCPRYRPRDHRLCGW